MESQQVKITGFLEFESVLRIKIEVRVNEHGYMKAEGILTKESFEGYKTSNGLWKSIAVYNNYDTMLFWGVITKLDIQEDTNLRYVEVVGATRSLLTDISVNSRSFMNTEMTYKEVMTYLEDSETHIQAGKFRGRKLITPLIQYNVTDWQFLKLIAGRFETVIVPGYTNHHNTIFLGNPSNKTENNPYRLGDDINFTRKRIFATNMTQVKNQQLKNRVIEQWKFTYEQNLEIGDWVTWRGIKVQIYGKKCVIDNGLLVIEYDAGFKQCYNLTNDENDSIEGLTLEGTILSTEKEMIKIALDIDAKKDTIEDQVYAYPYMPESGNVFYSMPEPGMRACLYFPDGYENHGYVIHIKRAFLRKYPEKDVKEFRYPNNNAMHIDPGSLQFILQGKNRSSEVCIAGRNGVQVKSNNMLRLIAKGQIIISSGRACTIESSQQISINQIGTDNYVDMCGDDIVYSSKKYVAASCLRDASALVKNKSALAGNMLHYGEMIDYVIGGMVSNGGNELELAILGGIPSSTSFARERNIYSALGKNIRR